MESDFLWQDRKHFLWWPISFTTYKLTDRKLYQSVGLLSTEYDETLLYRIIDCRCTVSLLQRLCGTGTVELIGIDRSTPTMYLKNIKDPLLVKELISDLAIKDRKRSGLVEVMQ